MAKINQAPDADSFVSEIQIAAPPERVFQALTDPKQVVRWWGGQGGGASYRCTEFSADLRVGGKWRCAGTRDAGDRFEIAGEFLKVDPPRCLEQTWVASWTGEVKTVVRWELEPTARGTLLRIRHSGFGAHPEAAQNYRGWPRMLGWVQALVERGETVDDRRS